MRESVSVVGGPHQPPEGKCKGEIRRHDSRETRVSESLTRIAGSTVRDPMVISTRSQYRSRCRRGSQVRVKRRTCRQGHHSGISCPGRATSHRRACRMGTESPRGHTLGTRRWGGGCPAPQVGLPPLLAVSQGSSSAFSGDTSHSHAALADVAGAVSFTYGLSVGTQLFWELPQFPRTVGSLSSRPQLTEMWTACLEGRGLSAHARARSRDLAPRLSSSGSLGLPSARAM